MAQVTFSSQIVSAPFHSPPATLQEPSVNTSHVTSPVTGLQIQHAPVGSSPVSSHGSQLAQSVSGPSQSPEQSLCNVCEHVRLLLISHSPQQAPMTGGGGVHGPQSVHAPPSSIHVVLSTFNKSLSSSHAETLFEIHCDELFVKHIQQLPKTQSTASHEILSPEYSPPSETQSIAVFSVHSPSLQQAPSGSPIIIQSPPIAFSHVATPSAPQTELGPAKLAFSAASHMLCRTLSVQVTVSPSHIQQAPVKSVGVSVSKYVPNVTSSLV